VGVFGLLSSACFRVAESRLYPHIGDGVAGAGTGGKTGV
jgi:hypothetical protein